MAGRKENLKALFTNTRSRVIIIFTLIILITAVIISYIRFHRAADLGENASANLPTTPFIQSIPGALNPTEQYAKLQEAQNVNQAKVALKTGASAIPTLIRSQEIGAGVQAIGSENGQSGGVGFETLAREDQEGARRNEWLQQLQNASCSRGSIQQVVQAGAQLTDVRSACSCVQLKASGYSLSALQPVCSCRDLKAAGFNALDFKNSGYTASQLRICGFDACSLKSAGFTAQQMKDGGFNDDELKGAGYPDNEIMRASGLPPGITIADVQKAQCSPAELNRLREAGVSAAAVRRIDGCSPDQLKAGGYAAQDLRNAGYSAADLLKSGFTPIQLRQAGFTARDLLNAGLLPSALANAGYSPAQIASGESELPPGVTADNIKDAGCTAGALAKARLAAVSAKLIRQYANCTAKQLTDGGFTADDLANAGFTPQQINATSPVADNVIRAAGCDSNKLKALMLQGVSATRIHELNGCNAANLKTAGFSARDLLNAGLKPQDLLAAGYNPQEIQAAAAATEAAIRAADCNPAKLRELLNAGIAASQIRAINNCDLSALRAGGYDAKALSDAGFTPDQLLSAGFAPNDLQAAGVEPVASIAAGRSANCDVASLTAAHSGGVSATTIKSTLGCGLTAMKAAGYTPSQLRSVGFTAAELKAGGFTAADLKNAGFTAGELRTAGVTAQQLKDLGFNANQLKEAGFGAGDLKNAGFNAQDLRAAGFNAVDLKASGFNAADLKNAGFSAADLKNAGFSNPEIQSAGYSAADLAAAGIPSSQVAGLGEAGTGTGTGVAAIPGINLPGTPSSSVQSDLNQIEANNRQVQAALNRQNQRLADQRFQQRIQQRTSNMLNDANQAIQRWEKVSTQVYIASAAIQKAQTTTTTTTTATNTSTINQVNVNNDTTSGDAVAIVKTGDILFAVIDTSVNSDEPGPILATIVSGPLKGSKLIGSFNLPSNSDKMVISFNTLSVPGASKTVSINAYAIDPNTARTALSSRTDHHYLLRYGSLFASSFLEGIGNAFQSSNTTVTIGGTGGGDNITVQNGIGRSTLENAVIGLATVGKSWGQAAQQQFNRPTTVEVYSGTPVGILFTQDLTSI